MRSAKSQKSDFVFDKLKSYQTVLWNNAFQKRFQISFSFLLIFYFIIVESFMIRNCYAKFTAALKNKLIFLFPITHIYTANFHCK